MTPTSPLPDPAPVLDLLMAFRRSKVMFAGVTLGVFDALEAGPKTAAALATELKADGDALGRLLDACVGLHLLTRSGEGYANTPTATAYLTSASPRRLTGYLRFTDEILWKLWGNLADAVRDGTHGWKRTFGWDGPIFGQIFHTPDLRREFTMGMHGMGVISSPQVVAAFDLSRFRTLVDLGGATGHLAVAACRRYTALRATVFDLPEVTPIATELVGASDVSARVGVVSGDFFVDELPASDLYSLGRILHDWSEDKILLLLQKVYDRLPAGGALLVAEKLINDDRTGPDMAQMQDLNMLLVTEGKERTLGEYAALLRRVGFASVDGRATGAPVDAILAVK
ncbi:class I SAM-dependent methyltransferase [Gemmata sp.]|uniref:class I SAM-dependent methyltransferase n=1 Tax=Gemmata sp. TaxID=1914242 RepID=UPI003F728EBF